ncbi:AglZ/HisF2 family acetamidino modification protein [Massilia pinisoli]|uniref:imidazole glycerol-phosphate synthase n=1 Tax=Massilia pinisoli TaxID=1772194 RepID=A0ABT1ZN12_9BURK|nr:AglZ/HisF2 family acetamidino modification protein [Massilia pinisoli]MCS0581293.1 AglZ/HisF2 family acetamidino modification protein [Massilia pinisoli]
MTTVFNRVIPCLLLQDGGLVKTQGFRRPRYVGDPINAVRIFNDKYVDELVFLDIDASRTGAEPNYDLIQRIAGECFMPLCYGGGIRTLEQARRIVAVGVEKIAVNSMAIDNPALLSAMSAELGASSVVAGIDVKRDFFGRERVFHPGKRRLTSLDPVAHAVAVVRAGAGEIFLNSVDRDGRGTGFDVDLIARVSAAVNVPVIACGGAAGLDDMRAAVQSGASAAAAGSMFVFYGPHRAVLINYPAYGAVRELFSK